MKPLKLFTGAAIIVVGAASLLVGCGSAASSDEPPNTDPRVGVVRVFHEGSGITKQCDSTTLLYLKHGGGLAAVADSPECQPM